MNEHKFPEGLPDPLLPDSELTLLKLNGTMRQKRDGVGGVQLLTMGEPSVCYGVSNLNTDLQDQGCSLWKAFWEQRTVEAKTANKDVGETKFTRLAGVLT